MNKKAQGEIITTVLIILLVLAAVVIVWQAVKGTVTKGTESIDPKLACIDIGLEIVKASTTGNVTVTRGPGGADSAVTNVTILVSGVVKPIQRIALSTGAATTDSSLTQMQTKLYDVGPITAGTEVKVAAVIGANVCNVVDTATATA